MVAGWLKRLQVFGVLAGKIAATPRFFPPRFPRRRREGMVLLRVGQVLRGHERVHAREIEGHLRPRMISFLSG